MSWRGGRAPAQLPGGFSGCGGKGTHCVTVPLPCHAGTGVWTAAYSLRQLLLPYRAGQAAAGLMPVETAEPWDSAGSQVAHTAPPPAASQQGRPSATSPGLNTSMLPSKAEDHIQPCQPLSQGQAAMSSSPLARGFMGTSKPLAQGKSLRCPRLSREKRDRAPVPVAFCGAPSRHRRLAGAARARSRAGRGSICFAPPRGFLNRSPLFYSLWDLEKPVVPDNPWTRQHRHSGGSPGTRRWPPMSLWGGGTATADEVGEHLGSPPHPEPDPGVLLSAERPVPSHARCGVCREGLSPPPRRCCQLRALPWDYLQPDPVFSLGRGSRVPVWGVAGCNGVRGAVHPCTRRTPACAGCGAACSG